MNPTGTALGSPPPHPARSSIRIRAFELLTGDACNLRKAVSANEVISINHRQPGFQSSAGPSGKSNAVNPWVMALFLPGASSRALRGIWRADRHDVRRSSHARSLTRLNCAGFRDDANLKTRFGHVLDTAPGPESFA